MKTLPSPLYNLLCLLALLQTKDDPMTSLTLKVKIPTQYGVSYYPLTVLKVIRSLFMLQAILPIEQSIPRSTYIHPPAVNAAKGAF